MKKITKTLVVLAVILTLTLTACGAQSAEPTENVAPAPSVLSADSVVAEGHIKPALAANLSFQARGTVEEVNVKVGDRVSAGDVLARISNASQAEAQLAAANLELLDAQFALDTLVRTGDANLAQAWTAYTAASRCARAPSPGAPLPL